MSLLFSWLCNGLCYIPHSVRHFLAWILAGLFLIFGRSRKRVFQANMRHCKHLEQYERLGSKVSLFQSAYFHARALLDFLASIPMSSQSLSALYEVVGLEHLDQKNTAPLHAYQGKTPTILFAPHFVGLPMATRYSAAFMDAGFMYSPSKSKAVALWMKREYDRLSGGRAFIKTASILPIARILKNGGVVQLSTDLDVGERDSMSAPFFGTLCYASHAIPFFAKRYGARVLGLSCYYQGMKWGVPPYRLEIEPININSANEEPSEVMAQTLINAWLEKKITQYALHPINSPAQYWWFHKRFKTAERLGITGIPSQY